MPPDRQLPKDRATANGSGWDRSCPGALRNLCRHQFFVDAAGYFIAHPPEDSQFFIVRTDGGCRVVEAPVQEFEGSGENRATLFCVVADRHDVWNVLPQKTHNIFRLLVRNIDSNFVHGFDGKGIQPLRFDSRAQGFKLISRDMPEIAFRHLAASRISCTEKQDFRFRRLHVPNLRGHAIE